MNELLLITENCGGLCERNFVSTPNELRDKFMGREDPQTVENFLACISLSAGCVNVWNTLYISKNTSLDIRACVDSSDLMDFLSGKFNANCEMMSSRYPGSLSNECWFWDNDIERFSPRAIDIINRECPGQLEKIGLKHHGGKTSLADIIKKASFIKDNAMVHQQVSLSAERFKSRGK